MFEYYSLIWKGNISFEQLVLWLKINNFVIVSYFACIYEVNSDRGAKSYYVRQIDV